MLLWLNGLPGIPGLTSHRNPVETLIDTYSKRPLEIGKFLEEDEFLIQLRQLNPKLMDFVFHERKQICKELIRLIVQKCEEVTDANYQEYITYPMIAIEVMVLDVPPIMNAFFDDSLSDELFSQLFSLLDREDTVPEPQLSNLVKFVQPLMDRNIKRVCQFIYHTPPKKRPPILQCLNHIYSPQVTNFMIAMFNPDNTDRLLELEKIRGLKLHILRIGIEGLNQMKGSEALNFMLLVHEIMTRFMMSESSNEIMNYLVSLQAINRVYEVFKARKSIYLMKAAVHILSLVSNYYSYSMQNITIIDETISDGGTEYHSQLSQQFETSGFFTAFSENMYLFDEVLQQVKPGSIGVLTFKVIEIFDNLVRISNLKLWKVMKQLKLLQSLLGAYFRVPNANIIHSITEKLFLYIFNRAVSDFHPFWAQEIFVECDLTKFIAEHLAHNPGPLTALVNNISEFTRELDDKILSINQGPYVDTLRLIQNHLRQSKSWQNCQRTVQLPLRGIFNPNAYVEETSFIDPSDKEKDKSKLFTQTKTNYVEGTTLQTSGDDPLEDEYDEQPKEVNRAVSPFQTSNPSTPTVTPQPLEGHVQETVVVETFENVPTEEDEEEQITFKKQESLPPEPKRYESSPSPHNTRSDENSSPDDGYDFKMSTSQDFTLRRKSSAMESSLKLKSMGEDNQSEFQISQELLDRVVVQPQSKKVLRVDEIDMEKNDDLMNSMHSIDRPSIASSDVNSMNSMDFSRMSENSRSKMKIVFKTSKLSKTLKFTEEGEDLNTSLSSSIASVASLDGRRYRKVSEKDKKFLSFLQGTVNLRMSINQ